MSKKDMNDKLLGAVRAAKTHSGTTSAAQPKSPRTGITSGVGQSDQTPAPNLDHPWDNLHPDRIWPD